MSQITLTPPSNAPEFKASGSCAATKSQSLHSSGSSKPAQRPSKSDQRIYHSQAIKGFWLQIEWLWQEPLPTVLDTLRKLKLI